MTLEHVAYLFTVISLEGLKLLPTFHWALTLTIQPILKVTRPRQLVPNSGFYLVGPGLILVDLI